MQRLVLPLLICFVLSLGFLLMPNVAYQATVGATGKLHTRDASASGKLA